jgi:hypothetical protein
MRLEFHFKIPLRNICVILSNPQEEKGSDEFLTFPTGYFFLNREGVRRTLPIKTRRKR